MSDQAHKALTDPEGKQRRTDQVLALFRALPKEADHLNGLFVALVGMSATTGDLHLMDEVFDRGTILARLREFREDHKPVAR